MGRVLTDKKTDPRTAYRIEISSIHDVFRTAKEMMRYSVKKSHDLEILIDYLEDKITGDEAISRFNDEVRSGRRSGIICISNLPHIRTEGVRMTKQENARRARAAHAVHVDSSTEYLIRKDHSTGMGHYSLSRKYKLSESIIRRVLRGD